MRVYAGGGSIHLTVVRSGGPSFMHHPKPQIVSAKHPSLDSKTKISAWVIVFPIFFDLGEIEADFGEVCVNRSSHVIRPRWLKIGGWLTSEGS